MKVQTEFYADLYKKVPIDVDACKNLLDDITVKITEEECELCEADLSLQEVEYVRKSLKRECSPGYDEITNEYNKVYWSVIKEEFVNVINEINKEGQMCNTQSMGIITLLYKNGDRNDITNWRPITLLNINYKITEKIFVNGIILILENIIHSDQKAGRQISENVRLAHDITSYCENYKKNGSNFIYRPIKCF